MSSHDTCAPNGDAAGHDEANVRIQQVGENVVGVGEGLAAEPCHASFRTPFTKASLRLSMEGCSELAMQKRKERVWTEYLPCDLPDRTPEAFPGARTRNPLLLGKHELHLGPQLPVGAEVGTHDIVVGAELRVHGKLAEMEDLSDAATQR